MHGDRDIVFFYVSVNQIFFVKGLSLWAFYSNWYVIFLKDEKLEDYQVIPRHNDWEQCPQGALALYTVTRFHVDMEEYLRMDKEKRDW